MTVLSLSNIHKSFEATVALDGVSLQVQGRLSAPRPIDDWSPESVMQAAIGGDANPGN
jgi:hypothetical protein